MKEECNRVNRRLNQRDSATHHYTTGQGVTHTKSHGEMDKRKRSSFSHGINPEKVWESEHGSYTRLAYNITKEN